VQPLLLWKGKKILHKLTVFLALGIQQATRIRHVVICGLTGSKIFSTLSEKKRDLKK
jgi:tRNA A22 N-methylase